MLPDKVAERFKAAGYKLQNKIIWLKSVSIDQKYIGKKNELRNNSNNGTISIGHFTPINSDRYLNNLYEYVFHFTKKEDVKLDKLAIGVTYQDKSNIGRYAEQDKRDRGDVWFIPYDTIQKGRDHPAPFPIEIPQWSIELHGIKPNMLVYDPFMGEGNTAKACVGLGVNYIGTEINPTYIKTANEEISRITPTLEIQEDLTQSNTQSGSLLSYFKHPGEGWR